MVFQAGTIPRALRMMLGALAMLIGARAFALEVYLNTNSPANVSRGSEFFDAAKWRDATKAVDGIWYVAQGMTEPPKGVSIAKAREEWIKRFADKKWIVELQGRAAEGHHTPHEVKALKEAGIHSFSTM